MRLYARKRFRFVVFGSRLRPVHSSANESAAGSVRAWLNVTVFAALWRRSVPSRSSSGSSVNSKHCRALTPELPSLASIYSITARCHPNAGHFTSKGCVISFISHKHQRYVQARSRNMTRVLLLILGMGRSGTPQAGGVTDEDGRLEQTAGARSSSTSA